MRSSRVFLRGAKGYGWYKKYMEKGEEAFQKNVPPTPFLWTAPDASGKTILRPKAHFDITIAKEAVGRLTFELAADIVPTTVYNFARLCLKEGKYGYAGTKIHRIHKGIALMGGDVEKNDGTGNFSSFKSRYFEDENFIIPQSARGLISMASVGVHTNGSQFYISFSPCAHMNGRCMVFGRVMEESMPLLKQMEELFTFRGSPAAEVVISECSLSDHEEFMERMASQRAENHAHAA